MATAFLPAVSALRAAGEPTRLRLLALLMRAELTVGEICEILGQSQPRISRHLKILSAAGMLDRVREQNWVYYRAPLTGEGLGLAQHLLAVISAEDEVIRRDRKRLAQVLQARVERTSSTSAAVQSSSDAAVDALVVRELADAPIGALLDVGTGRGHWLQLLGAQASRAMGVDISTDALRVARTQVHSAGLSHCHLQHGDMYNLPFGAAVFDTVTVDRALATAERPLAVLAEIARTLRPGGRVVVIEDFDALEERAGGNPIALLREWLERTGFKCQRLHPLDTERGHVLVSVARDARSSSAAA